MTNNITVIIPIHEVQENLDKYLKNALLSVEQQTLEPSEVLIVRSKDKKLKTFLDDFDFGGVKDKIRVVENKSKDTSFQSQMNLELYDYYGDLAYAYPHQNHLKVKLSLKRFGQEESSHQSIKMTSYMHKQHLK